MSNLGDATCQVIVRTRPWSVRFLAEYQAVLGESGLTALVLEQLEAQLAKPGRGRWRTWIDVAGWLGSVAVDEDRGEIVIGSPRFSSEQALAEWTKVPEVAELVDAWRLAEVGNGPLAVETAIARHGLVDVVGEPNSWLAGVNVATAELARRLQPGLRAHRETWIEQASQWGLGWMTRSALLRVHILRFVAALPALDHDHEGEVVVRLLREAMRRLLEASEAARAAEVPDDDERGPLPPWMARAVRIVLAVAGWLPAAWVAKATRAAVRRLARVFLAGESLQGALPSLESLLACGRDATFDPLGELVVSEPEADAYCARVLELVQGLHLRWGLPAPRNSAGIPRAHVSLKVSALCSDYDPDDPDGVWRRVGPRLLRILREARANGVGITLDAEHYPVRDLTLRMLERATAEADIHDFMDVGIVVQAYLRDAAEHVDDVLAFCGRRGVRLPVRLVKGAYWDAETTEAAAHDHIAPQFLNKAETDAMFQALVLRLLSAPDAIQLCIGSHNLRDHCFAEAARARMHHDANASQHQRAPVLEHQVLHQTYEALAETMAAAGWAVRSYVPVGSLLVGMAYLVRRILENSSQVGVLTMARQDEAAAVAALAPPAAALQELRAVVTPAARDGLCENDPAGVLPFRNVAPVRLHLTAHRAAFEEALALPVARMPVEPTADIDGVVRRAVAGFERWRRVPARQRAALLVRAAEQMRAERHDWAAAVLHEAGKARNEALGDVDEAIDFLQFYAREAVRRGDDSGVPVGVVAAVTPWNFPLAIPTGMVAGPLAAGNAVVLKSAEQTPQVAERLVRLLHAVGVPGDVVQHAPGDGPTVGAPLVAHPAIAGAVFTGSRAVGTRIHKAIGSQPHGPWLRRAVTEMGGKNAAFVTATADLDEAVAGCLRSAFGHAGQKCSALSRVLVDARVADHFIERFTHAAEDLHVGPAAKPGVRVNPVITTEDRDRLRSAAVQARAEADAVGGKVLCDRSTEGEFVGPVVVQVPAAEGLRTGSLALTELFGPVVHVLPVRDADEAVAVARAAEYALTGGVFSQSDDEIDAMLDRWPAGNCYVNRNLTGARVAVEPFGGHAMSGTGPKAGGADYLDAFRHAAMVAESPRLDAEAVQVLAAWTRTGAEMPVRRGAQASKHLGAHAPNHHESPAADVPPLCRAAALLRALPHAGLPPHLAPAVHGVLSTALDHLPRLASAGEPTRRIPGQVTRNVWSLPRGPVAVLAGSARPTEVAVAHAIAAVTTGNRVAIYAFSTASAAAWSRMAESLAAGDVPPWSVHDCTDASSCVDALMQPHLATIVLDGTAAQWSAALPHCVAQPPGQRHLRQVHALGSLPAPPDWIGVLKAHLLVRTIAVNVMRHGAVLSG
jgi:RHH-type proline utilization regulon transcriptional repressor/proline dehydrogenase/delta 1-pyrroline-5-carboxylate dehydrogenase